jgi:multisubunit Na+/H+ antiporter MnhB subunit
MKLLKDRRKILRSYSFLSMLGNFLIALSVSGLAVLGVLSSDIAFPLLAGLAISFGLFGLVGRFIDQQLEDNQDAE